MDQRLAECQRVVGYHFANPELLEIALRHSSLRTPDLECNERLEFLGDSVLGLVITEELYRLLPDQAEGELTRIKSAVVARGALYRTSQRLGLARFAQFARGVSRRDELPVSVTANLVEAIIGAIYLDAGFFPAREFVLSHLGHEIDDTLHDRGAKNYKSLLQHEVQQAAGATPTYRTLEEDGPEHRRDFVVAALIRGREWGRASGPTKKDAEQEAARMALEAWQRRGRGRRRRAGDEAPPREARPEPAAFAPAPPAPEPAPARIAGWEEPEPEEARHPAPVERPAPSPEGAAAEGDRDALPGDRGRRRRGRGRGEPLPSGTRQAPAPAAPEAGREPPPREPRRAAPAPPEQAARARAASAAREPAPPRPAPPAGADGFAEGIPDVPAAAPPPPRAPRPSPAAPAASRVEERRKAPVVPPKAPAEEGFDSGL